VLFEGLAHGDSLAARFSRYYAGECHAQLGVRQLSRGDYAAAARSFQSSRRFNSDHTSVADVLSGGERGGTHHAQISGIDSAMCEALALWRAGQTDAALLELESIVESRPADAEVHYQYGLLLAAAEEYDAAINAFKAAVVIAPHHHRATAQIGLCYGVLRRPREAVPHLATAQRLAPHDPAVGLWLALACEAAAGRPARIAPMAVPAVESRALDVADVELLGNVLHHEPELVEALTTLQTASDDDVFSMVLASLNRAILDHPGQADLFYYRGRIYERLGETQRAIGSYERAVVGNPRHTAALVALGKLYHAAARSREAERRLAEVLRLGCNYADVHYVLGCIYRDQGDRARARRAYQQALTINESYRDAREALSSLAA
jgi:tetratricopeptide (TPR) repeat protein